jgi:hypothetical protein
MFHLNHKAEHQEQFKIFLNIQIAQHKTQSESRPYESFKTFNQHNMKRGFETYLIKVNQG